MECVSVYSICHGFGAEVTMLLLTPYKLCFACQSSTTGSSPSSRSWGVSELSRLVLQERDRSAVSWLPPKRSGWNCTSSTVTSSSPSSVTACTTFCTIVNGAYCCWVLSMMLSMSSCFCSGLKRTPSGTWKMNTVFKHEWAQYKTTSELLCSAKKCYLPLPTCAPSLWNAHDQCGQERHLETAWKMGFLQLWFVQTMWHSSWASCHDHQMMVVCHELLTLQKLEGMAIPQRD